MIYFKNKSIYQKADQNKFLEFFTRPDPP